MQSSSFKRFNCLVAYSGLFIYICFDFLGFFFMYIKSNCYMIRNQIVKKVIGLGANNCFFWFRNFLYSNMGL